MITMIKIMDYKIFTKSLFRGIGQVMFQNNALTGFLFLVGIFCASWLMGVGALIGVLIGTLTALLFGYKEKDITDGLYGFNGVLVSIALLFLFNPTILLFIFIILAVVLSVVVMNFMYAKKFSPYTFPFVLTTWIFIFLITFFNISTFNISDTINFAKINILSGVALGFSQVMFQASIITGLIFFIAVLINSRISAIYALVGSLVGLLFSLLFFPYSLNLINIGIFGFNGVLCGIAFVDKKSYSFIFALISIVLSTIIIYGFIGLNLIALTAPFVFATWITMFVRSKIQKNVVNI